MLPSYAECPRCAEREGRAAAPPPVQPQAPPPQPAYPPQAPPPAYPQAPPPQQPVYGAQPQQPLYAPPQQPVYAPPAAPPQAAPPPTPLMDAPSTWAPPPQQYPQPPQPGQQEVYYIGANNRKRMPPWLGAVLAIAVLGGGLFALYKYVGSRNGTDAPAAAKMETPGEQAIAGHPYQKHLELAALRLIESEKKVSLRFSVVNHSAADLSGVGLRVSLTTTAAAAGDPPLAVFDAKVGDVAAYGTKEMEVPIKTEKRVYELPDWQFLKAGFEITAPK